MIIPMVARLVKEPFDRPAWLFELKWDGFRAIAERDHGGHVSLYSRNTDCWCSGLLRHEFIGMNDSGTSFRHLRFMRPGACTSRARRESVLWSRPGKPLNSFPGMIWKNGHWHPMRLLTMPSSSDQSFICGE